MEKLGHLTRLYTAYPKVKVDNLPSDKVRTFPWVSVPMVLLERAGFHGMKRTMTRFAIESFGRWMAKNLVACDINHALSSFGLEANRIARERYGALTICDRGSAHIVYQNEILAEEYARWNVPYQPIDPWVIDRELQEYEESDLIFVPSTFAHRSFVTKGISDKKLRKVPYGIDLQTFHPVPKKDGVFRIMYVGALSLQKGVQYFLQAVSKLRIPGLEVWLIGGLLPEVKPLLDRYKDRIRYFGVLSRTQLFEYYSQGSVFVMPSVQDGFGLVQAQAMACGLPVIATTNSGAEDLFTDGKEGFIVPIRNADAIYEKIMYLFENPRERDEMGRLALSRVQQLGGWRTYGERVSAYYEEALSVKRSSGNGL